ncbi:MAG: iron-containing alcohol dehydrogenase [Alphaproteobacteria bacterium]|nr:MAG: iron-containing alcohol dehydrogenase [Alphaproteobacteria bacterium]
MHLMCIFSDFFLHERQKRDIIHTITSRKTMLINQTSNAHSARIIGQNLAHQNAEMLQKYTSNHRILYVSDTPSYEAFTKFFPLIEDRFHLYEASPTASRDDADDLARLMDDAELVIGIGSGTINDLCKYAAFQRGIPYIIIATAPSMNGYTSANASLLHDGHKQSFACFAPILCIADIDLLAHAPARLRAAGVGDTLCRSVIMADLALAHHLCGSPTYSDYFAMMHNNEMQLVRNLEAERGVGIESTKTLMTMLLDAGDAMHSAHNSAPASQGEHMMAHLLEILAPDVTEGLYHGELISITTLAYAALQEQCIQQTLKGFTPVAFPKNMVIAPCDPDLHASWHRAYEEKCAMLLPEAQRPALPAMPARLTYDALTSALRYAGCPLTWEDIGGEARDMQHALNYARFTRARWTYLDLMPYIVV